MLGSGIFVLPGLAAAKTGPMVWMAYLVAGLGVLPAALSKSELATAMPTSGGTYVYLERAFGPLAGTVSGIGLWLSLLLKSAFALVGFSAYLSVLIELPEQAVALTLLAGITLLNVLGVSVIGKLQKVIVMVVLVLLLLLAAFGLTQVDLSNFKAGYTHGTHGFIAAAAFVYVSYAGVTKVAAIAEEVKDPGRNLPLGILISWISVMCVYVFVVFVLVANVSDDQLTNYQGTGKPDLHPIYTLACILGGKTIGVIAAVLAVLTMTSMAVAGLLAASRFPFAMSRDQLLPEKLHEVNSKFMTPVYCILLTSTVMGFSILFLPVEQIAKLASAFMILAFMFICGTVVVLRESAATWYKPRFRAPLYPWVQIIGVIAGVTLLSAMGLTSLAAIAGICILGGFSYAVYGRHQTSRLGVVGRMGRRRDLVGQGSDDADPDDRFNELDDELPKEAAVVVSLFGSERIPETLVEMGAALAHGRKLEVLHVTEVPERIYLADVVEEDHLSIALSRRIHVMAEENGVNLEYNKTVSHDVGKTIHKVADQLHCEWVVMESAGKRARGITFQNQLGWLQDHLPCNLAVFKDAGVRYIRKILVFAEPGPHDSLVVTTADHLAQIYNAELSFICFEKTGDDPHHARAAAEYVDQLRNLCLSPTEVTRIHGDDEMLAIEKETEQYDLLVMGAPPVRNLTTRLFGTEKDKLTRNSACSVLWLRTPATQTHQAVEEVKLEVERDFDLMSYVSPDCVGAKVALSKKEDVFRLATEMLAKRYRDDISPIVIQTALWEREQLQNTAVGYGVAMPHATLTRAASGESAIAILTTKEPIDVGALDGELADVFFVTMGSPADRQIHLKILADLSKLTLNRSFLESLRASSSSDEVLSTVRSFLAKVHPAGN